MTGYAQSRTTVTAARAAGVAWRAGRDLGVLLGLGERNIEDLDDELDNLWHASWMDRGVPEREREGRRLLAVGRAA